MTGYRTMTCGNTKYASSGIKQNVDGWTRRVEFEPGHDCIDDYPKCWQTMGGGRHGRSGMRLRILLGSEEGIVQFVMSASDWLPGSLDSIGSTKDGVAKFGVMATDLGHHWTRPTYEGEYVGQEACEFLHGASCFYDGSGLNAGPVLDRFLREGLDAVWESLEEYHRACSESATALSLKVSA